MNEATILLWSVMAPGDRNGQIPAQKNPLQAGTQAWRMHLVESGFS